MSVVVCEGEGWVQDVQVVAIKDQGWAGEIGGVEEVKAEVL